MKSTFSPHLLGSLLAAISLAGMAACGGSNEPVAQEERSGRQGNIISALTCEGTNDTTLVFLVIPYNGTDPDTMDVLQATKNHRVYGMPRVGDNLAILPSSADSTVAERVVVIDDLCGRWTYQAYPTLRRRADMPANEAAIGDSLRRLLDTPLEYSIDFKNDHTMLAFGAFRRPSEDDLVEYPKVRRYTEWQLNDSLQLLLTVSATDTTGQRVTVAVDTARFVRLANDSLVLNINNTERSFARKASAKE